MGKTITEGCCRWGTLVILGTRRSWRSGLGSWVISSLDLPGRLGQWPLGFPLLDLPGRSGSMALGLHVKRKLGRRPGHRSIWTVFVSGRIRHVSIFPSLVEICRIQTVWVSKITMESWIIRKRWSWTRSRITRIKGKEEEDPRQGGAEDQDFVAVWFPRWTFLGVWVNGPWVFPCWTFLGVQVQWHFQNLFSIHLRWLFFIY